MQRAVWPRSLKKTAPAGEEGARLRQLPLPLTHRRVRWLPARHSSAATTSLPLLTPLNKINARSLCGRAALWKEFYFPNGKACATKTVGNVCSNNRKFVMFPLLEWGCSSFQVACARRYLHMWTASHCIASMGFNTSAKLLPNRGKSLRGNTAGATARNRTAVRPWRARNTNLTAPQFTHKFISVYRDCPSVPLTGSKVQTLTDIL